MLADAMAHTMPLEFRSSTEVRCVAPGGRPGETMMVHVSNDGVRYSPVGLRLQYHQLPALMSISPTSGPMIGGSLVTIRGKGFDFSPDLRCVFGGLKLVPALLVSDTEIRCIAPSRPSAAERTAFLVQTGTPLDQAQRIGAMSGPVDTSVDVVSSNGTLAFSSGSQTVGQLTFRYVDSPTASAVLPSHGPPSGGTVVTVTGTGFVKGSSMCLFGPVPDPVSGEGGVAVPANVVNSTVATCVSPPMPAEASVSPMQTEGAVAVRLSTNGGADYGHSSARFLYLHAPRLQRMVPTTGPELGGTTIRVQTVGSSTLFHP